MEDELTPTGTQVTQTGVAGLGDAFRQLGAIALNGISRRVDMEFTSADRVPDTSQTTNADKIDPPGFGDVVKSLTPVQIGGLLLAGGLAWALATGKFR